MPGKGPMAGGKGVGRRGGIEPSGSAGPSGRMEPGGGSPTHGRPESPGRSASSPGHLKKAAGARDASSFARGRSRGDGSESEPEA
jgi:hypothetical protein